MDHYSVDYSFYKGDQTFTLSKLVGSPPDAVAGETIVSTTVDVYNDCVFNFSVFAWNSQGSSDAAEGSYFVNGL